MWTTIPYTSSKTNFVDVPFEYGFYCLILFLKYFDLPTTSIFIATSFLQILFLTLWLRRHLFLSHWFIYFFFTSLFIFEAMNAVRQTISFGILLLAMVYIIERKPIKFAGLVLLASLMHKSALIFLPLYFLLDREWITSRTKQVFILLIFYGVANALKDLLFEFLPYVSLLINYENYSSIQEDLFFENNSGGYSLGLLFVFATDFFIILNSSRMKIKYANQGYRIYYNMFLIGALCTPVVYFANYVPFARLLFYFSSFKFVVLSFLLQDLLSKKSSMPLKTCGMLLIATYFIWFTLAISKGAAWCAPFRFVFE